MNVLVLGATGLVGGAIARALRERGVRVLAAARSEAGEAKLRALGLESVRVDLGRSARLYALASAADAAVYAVRPSDLADPLTSERAALLTLVDALARGGRPLLSMSSTWVYGTTGSRPATESDPVAEGAWIERELALERVVLDGAAVGVRPIVVRAGIVYGSGAGYAAMLVRTARSQGAATTIGDGANRWAMIAAADLGALCALALAQPHARGIYNAVEDEAPSVREIAAAASRGMGKRGAVESAPVELLGMRGVGLALDQRVSAARAKGELGWFPQPSVLLQQLEDGIYLPTRI